MPGYISKSGLVYSAAEVAKIVSDDYICRTDFRMGTSPAQLPERPTEAEIPGIIERYERDKKYND